MTTEEVSSICATCNEKKWAAKAASEMSSRFFLYAYLRRQGFLEQTAIVTSLGSSSFTIFLPRLVIEEKVNEEEEGKVSRTL
mmetsp:Transcript_43274/g.136795  ORF Transcript_43274/g.136795 Transcript_43274/m.136795 type:complete len:82 (-) Transcript_43274:203-448(-)